MEMQTLQKRAKLLVVQKFPFINHLYFAFLSLLKLPPQGAKEYLTYKYGFKKGSAESISIKVGDKVCLKLRKNRTDIKIFEQIFLLEDCTTPIKKFQPKLIIDGGAHIGCASVYFSLKYPDAKIIAVEVEASNFRQLRENVTDLPNVEAIHAAIYSHHGFITLENPEDDEWGFRVKSMGRVAEKQMQKIPTVTIDELIRNSGYGELDLLKLDIEGAELEVFQASPSQWLPLVTVINIELHDRFKPGCSEAFQKAISGYNFVKKETVHNVIWMNMSILQMRDLN